MLDKRINEMFENEKRWLRDQPDMDPWERGCRSLCEQLDRWTATYSEPLCDEVVTANQNGYTDYITRLWRCWSHHWAQAAETSPIEGGQVAVQIQNGQGYQRGKNLGGNPLRDVVLAIAMTEKEDRAIKQFEEEYFEYAKNLSGKVNRRYGDDAEDWWNEFLDYLGGYTKQPGKLHSFKGSCALRFWLGTVLWRFLRNHPLPVGTDIEELAAKTGANTEPRDDVADKECIRLFRSVIDRALAELESEQRLLLALIYIDGLKGKEVAAILRVHPGQITRRRDAALQRLRMLTDQHAASMQQNESFQDCLNALSNGQTNFSTGLIDALEFARNKDAEQ